MQHCSHGFWRCCCAETYSPGSHHHDRPPDGGHEACSDAPLSDAETLEVERLTRESNTQARIKWETDDGPILSREERDRFTERVDTAIVLILLALLALLCLAGYLIVHFYPALTG